jgi:hypothetical protein
MGISAGIAAVSSIASMGLSAYGQVEQGKGNKAANEMRAAQAERAAQIGRINADSTDATLTERLKTTLGNIDAIRAAGNVDPASPTTAAIDDLNTKLSNRQRLAAVGTIREQASTDDASANYLRSAGSFALNQGYVGAGISVAGGLAKGLGPNGPLRFGSPST